MGDFSMGKSVIVELQEEAMKKKMELNIKKDIALF